MTLNRIIEEIKSKCNIIDVVGHRVVLKKTGNNHKGLCPFHNEKTPSFVVSEDKQIFTCFGCGATGDVIEFVQRYENLGFREAIEKLALEYGVDIGTYGFDGNEKRAVLYDINREAAAYYYSIFRLPENKGRRYMEGRGIDPETLRRFGIGYADETWDGLYCYLVKKGIEKETLISLGLVSQSKGKYYDKFRERIIFPIINTRGKVIGFGGRVLGDGLPKYLNSPETPVFAKKNNLYGLNLTRQDINKEDYAILVEGYMDVISLYQHGVRNVVATLGTALTEGQAAMIRRYTGNIIMAYDIDAPGRAATLNGMEVLREAGCKVKVLTISENEGKDPDEYIKKNGKEKFLELVRNAKPATQFKLDLLKDEIDMKTTEGSVTFLQRSAEILRKLSPVEADAYIKKISMDTNISEGAIRMEVHGGIFGGDIVQGQWKKTDYRSRKATADVIRAEGTTDAVDDAHIMLEKTLIRLMLLKSSYVKEIEPYSHVFMTREGYRIYLAIKALYRDEEEIDINQLKDSLEEGDRRILAEIENNIQLADKDETVFKDCINKIKITKEKKREEEIIKLLSILEDGNDKEVIEELTKELMKIQEGKESRRNNP